MAFDFGLLIVVILIALLMLIGAITDGALYFVLTTPFIVYLIVRVQELPDARLPSVGLAGLVIFNIYIAVDHIIRKED